jgi:ribonuclease R
MQPASAPAPAPREERRPEKPGRRPARSSQGLEGRTLRGTVDKNRKGFGFIQFENRKLEDLFLPPHLADSTFHGDRVEVEIGQRGEVRKLIVLEHRFRELVGRYSPMQSAGRGPRRGGFVVYERKRAREEVFLPMGGGRAQAGDWIRCSLEFHAEGPHQVTAEVIEVYGAELPATADVQMVAAEYGLIEEHSEEAEREARSFTLEVPGRDLAGRDDLREVPFLTIDGETARDFDDAVHVERRKSGYRLWVAIADVSHYVQPGSHLDQEALSRGTSVYFPERAFHMLPTALSTELCSLRPNVPRLSMACWIDYDRHGNPGEVHVMEAVIQSRRRATYTEIASELEEHGKDSSWEFQPHFELYRLIRKSRSDRGSIDFDLPEADVVVDEKGEPIEIVNRGRNDAHRLIEEFMIAANEGVTRWMMQRQWPFVYRVHDEPALAALQRFEELAGTVGIPVSFSSGKHGPEGSVSPKVLADVVRRVEGHPAQDLLNMALLRSLKQAIYSSTHGQHYGLASEAYTHFTSPIRRYPDLVVHRLIRWALRVEKRIEAPLKRHERDELEKELAEICDHCSYRERVAAEADREAIRLKQVRLMSRHLGDEFDAKVIGMTETGLFVQIATPFCEGMVSRDSMNDDFYEFNEERMVFFGRRTRRTYKVGQALKVRVVRTDLDRRQIDFGIISAASAGEDGGGGAAMNSNERPSPWTRQKSPRRRR